MATKQTGIRLPELTQRQLSALCESTGMTQSAVMITAIDRMYQQHQQENRQMSANRQWIYGRCGNGQSIFDVLRELQNDGDVPQNATTGDRYRHGDEANDPSIIGQITVRRNEMFAIKIRS